MDDLIGRLDAIVSVDRTAAEKAVGIVAYCSVEHSRAAMARAFTRRSAGAGRAINARKQFPIPVSCSARLTASCPPAFA